MNQTLNIQKSLFQQIRNKLDAHLSLVYEISKLLNISYDSAYRRIRGDKKLSMSELFQLCTHFEISVDALFNIDNKNIIFNSKALDSKHFDFDQYLNLILKDINNIKKHENKEIIYSAKDIPIFHLFQIPELVAFKKFLWLKTVLQFSEYEDKLFSIKEIPEETLKIGKQILNIYITIPTVELWNEETINSLLRQIEFYFESGIFANKEDALILCEKLNDLISHIQKQAEYGFKFLYNNDPLGNEQNYKLYYNEVILGDNTIFSIMDNEKVTYLTYNVLSLLITKEPYFCLQIEESLRNLMKKSSLISAVSEKERNRFFNKLYEKIGKLEDKVKS
ncbi:MAG: hypothetical protein KAT68_02280 [Bacteroidales bacterium]|nr:hypothetical protein [Bacteroidales bacterium]